MNDLTDAKQLVAVIETPTGEVRASFEVHNHDPVFSPRLSAGASLVDFPVYRHDNLILQAPEGASETRTVVGVSIVDHGIITWLEILAPRQVQPLGDPFEYVKFDGIELRPGTTILGGRESGFYDDYAVILEAQPTGGSCGKNEDWAYFVAGDHFGTFGCWILLDKVGMPYAPPCGVVPFPMHESSSIEELLGAGEREVLQYLSRHPKLLDDLKPAELEALTETIYRNLGFSTERLGAWNQADGGVDIVAVSISEAGVETRLAIQCKASRENISARPIRELAGVLDAFKAHQGIVATTSRFTQAAREQASGHFWKIHLQDRNDLLRRIISIASPEYSFFVRMLDEDRGNRR